MNHSATIYLQSDFLASGLKFVLNEIFGGFKFNEVDLSDDLEPSVCLEFYGFYFEIDLNADGLFEVTVDSAVDSFMHRELLTDDDCNTFGLGDIGYISPDVIASTIGNISYRYSLKQKILID